MAFPVTHAQDLVTCDLCYNPAKQFCNNCQVSLCADCISKHVNIISSITHEIVPFKNKKTNAVFLECKRHCQQRCVASCRECNVPVCMKCVTSSHELHSLVDLPQIASDNETQKEKEMREEIVWYREQRKDLVEQLDKVKREKDEQGGCTELEKQKLLDKIGHLMAKVYAGKEDINYREKKLNKVQEENKKITEELNNVVPVLKAQAEVWKSEFDAERDARERLHAEKTQLENDFKQLQLRNQQILDEMENFSKRQFQEMQQRHSSQNYQHKLQQHLRVGHQNQGSPYQIPQYPPQGYPSQAPGTGAMYSDGRSPPSVLSQIHGDSQEGDEPHQFECPKCNQTCPDMDTLQIHVLDCIDQDNP